MTDVADLLRDDAERWNASRPDLDLGACLDDALAARPRRRWLAPAVATAAVLVVAGVTASVVFEHVTFRPATPAPLAPIAGVTWSDPRSTGTVVFGDNTMRFFDGCQDFLTGVRASGQTLVQAGRIGESGVCSPLPTPPGRAGRPQRRAQRRLDHFYAVLKGPATWERSGDLLTVSSPGVGILRLTTDGLAAPDAVGFRWELSRFTDTDEQEHTAASEPFYISPDGSFVSDDACGRVTGSADVTDTHIAFHPAAAGADCDRAPADHVLRAMLAETVSYEIRGPELVLTDHAGRELVYGPQS